MMLEILLIGGGGHCRSVIDVIESEGKYTIVGIVDKQENVGMDVLGYKIIGSDDDLKELSKIYKNVCISVGQIKTPALRVKLFHLCKELGFELPSIISPIAYVSRHATVAEGTVIMHGAILNADVSIAENCIINSRALIEHDSSVAAHCHISTGVIINGGVKIEECCFIGSSTVIKEGMIVKENSFIKIGSIVI